MAAADTPAKVKISSGTAACMALLKGKDLWVCNLGDCRAVLCTGGTKAHAVSKDHAPEKNEAEAERLRTLVVQVNGGYVGDHVAVSRALGNIHYDSGKKVEGIISEPDVFKIAVDDEVDFLILASDGVWDPLKDLFAVCEKGASHDRAARGGYKSSLLLQPPLAALSFEAPFSHA